MKKILCVFLLFVLLISLASCDIAANYMETGYLYTTERDGSTYLLSRFARIYNIDLVDKTFSVVKNDLITEDDFISQNEFKYRFFAGEYFATPIPDGYEGVVKHIDKCCNDETTSVVSATGYVKDQILIGFVQVYNDTSGAYGNYAIENISYSIAFLYNADTDGFSVIKRFDDTVIVAFTDNTVIYWKDKAYYSYDLISNTENYLVEDKAYDAGLVQQSEPTVLANDEICVLHLPKSKMNKKTEYMYVYCFETNDFFELEWLQ